VIIKNLRCEIVLNNMFFKFQNDTQFSNSSNTNFQHSLLTVTEKLQKNRKSKIDVNHREPRQKMHDTDKLNKIQEDHI
jgi:hypothetical protein